MKFLHSETYGWKSAFHGLRNPLESWAKSDSIVDTRTGDFILGQKDLDLAHRMIKAGTSDSKFLRQIFVSVDITAPMYWWSQFDTYKIGTTANSTSKMHKLASTPITKQCFESDDYQITPVFDKDFYTSDDAWKEIITICETLRKKYNETKDKRYWKELIRILPESWLQTRTVTMNYAVLRNMYAQRQNHRLTEWRYGHRDNSQS